MFALHEKTQRYLCRAVFFGLCVAPTVLMSAWIVARNRPGYRAAYEEELSRQLGLAVSIGYMQHPRPGVTRFQGVRLADPETLDEIARVRVVETVIMPILRFFFAAALCSLVLMHSLS